jgi:uncharacterized protein (TIGR02996 family)
MDETAFLRTIHDHPGDDGPRLVYADWLDERGDPRGPWLRLEVERTGLPPADPRRAILFSRLEAQRPQFDPGWLAQLDRADRYTVLWPQDWCREIARLGEVGQPLHVLQGGHNQQTRFSDMKVRAGDYIYPLRVQARKVYLIARMRVSRATNPEEYLAAHPEDAHLVNRESCAGEVLAGVEGTPIQFNLVVPHEILERLSFRSQKAVRKIKYVVDGELTRPISLQGVFRLTAQSVRDLDALLLKGAS